MSQNAACLNCHEPLAGKYCGACGQHAVDPRASTWHVLKEGISDATDFDGRVLSTTRAILFPGRLTRDFLDGRRAPYLGPFKLFLLAGTALTTTWLLTRGVDAHYYGYRNPGAAAASGYINIVVRGSLTAAIAITAASWAADLGRRRLLDGAAFALHVVAALMLWSAAIIWVATGWKTVWGTVTEAPARIPNLPLILFLPSAIVGVGYITASVHRVFGGRWWSTAFRALLITAVGGTAVYEVLVHGL